MPSNPNLARTSCPPPKQKNAGVRFIQISHSNPNSRLQAIILDAKIQPTGNPGVSTYVADTIPSVKLLRGLIPTVAAPFLTMDLLNTQLPVDVQRFEWGKLKKNRKRL